MRAAFALPLLLLAGLPVSSFAEPPGISPSITTEREQARWAELEAQARVTDGDYEGALQAHKQAEAERSKADKQEMAARTPRRQ